MGGGIAAHRVNNNVVGAVGNVAHFTPQVGGSVTGFEG